MDKRKDELFNAGEKLEGGAFRFVQWFLHRNVEGFILYQKKKGGLIAGSATFFAILSFCPILLLIITTVGMMIGDLGAAQDLVLNSIKNNFPELATWIFNAIKKIVETQLSMNKGLNIINLGILLYASIGLLGSIELGIHQIVHKDQRGGKIVEDLKSAVDAALIVGFLILLLALTPQSPLLLKLKSWNMNIYSAIAPLVQYSFLPIVISLIFFTLYYKWISPIKIRLRDSFLGGLSFIVLLSLGKSFYWVYVKLFKIEFAQNFGSFYSLIIVVIWIYFLICSFFFGASVACSGSMNRNPSSAQ